MKKINKYVRIIDNGDDYILFNSINGATLDLEKNFIKILGHNNDYFID
ncbi:MAG: hypothetical protein MSH08_03910 [Ezakiella sp.]|nr:hypothetical protein [Ezakiella sp.]MDD7471667.1 hypothetical protein [Bacillota bacterium]MDY3923451.1 hypothetical protein [Ezakiella sp.]